MSDLGTILQRVGAGFQGNLPQFDAQRNQQEMLRQEAERARRAEDKVLSQERKVAAVQDAQVALQFIEAGAIDKAAALLSNRKGLIDQLGGDPSDTQELIDALAAGEVDAVKNELGLVTAEGVARGWIRPLVTTAEQTARDKLALDQADFKAKYGIDAPGTAPAPGPAGDAAPAGGAPRAGAPAPGGTEGAKIAMDQRRLALEEQKAAREKALFDAQQRDIPEQWMKTYLDATQGELAATQRAAELSQLVTDFEAAPVLPAGLRATLNELAKSVFGEQDSVTALRERFSGARNSQVMKNLPPGVASDRDIELAMAGYPGDKAPKENITSFLRGQVKVLALEAAYERFKVEYIDKNRSLRGVSAAWKQEAPRVFEEIKADIGKPLNTSYTIQDYEAEARKRGLLKQ